MNIDTIKGFAAIAISVGVMIGGLTMIYYKQNPTPVDQTQQIQRPLTVDDVELIFHRMNNWKPIERIGVGDIQRIIQNEVNYKVHRTGK